MSSLKIINAIKREKFKLFLLVLYIPVSCSLIGLLAYYMKSPALVIENDSFSDVFWFYANPFNGNFGYAHLFTLMLSLAFLILMIISTKTPKPVISIFQIRIILLMLIAVISLLVIIITLVMPLHYKPQYPLLLFLNVDAHLILVFLLTFLPVFRKLKTQLV